MARIMDLIIRKKKRKVKLEWVLLGKIRMILGNGEIHAK